MSQDLAEFRDEIGLARQSRARLKEELAGIRNEIHFAKQELGKLRRSGLPENNERITTVNERLDALERSYSATTGRLGEVSATFDRLYPDFASRNPGSTLQLFPAKIPILLLPVRIETKFAPNGRGGTELRVRVFPDDLQIDSHEDALTPTERADGVAYWEEVWTAGNLPPKQAEETRKKAWKELADHYGSARAAWIVRVLTPPQPVAGETSPRFPQVSLKPSSWTAAPSTHVMPDSWIVIAYSNGKEAHRVVSKPIREPLHVGPDPSATGSSSGSDIPVDDGMRWMIDFDEAEGAGMAVRFDLTSDEATRGFDRILVMGIKASVDTTKSAQLVSSLLDHHHYTDGFAFIPQGTPTNNTSKTESGYNSRDLGHEKSFRVELSDGLFKPTRNINRMTDAELFALAIGVDSNVFQHVEDSDATDQQDARSMAACLWPATMGYFLEQMMADTFSTEQVRATRRHFIDYVRGQGPLPALRAGGTPYGLLPVTPLKSLIAWQPEAHTGQQVVSLFKQLIDLWLRQANQTPRAGTTQDPDKELVEILGMESSSMIFTARDSIGPDYLRNLSSFMGFSQLDQWFKIQSDMARLTLNSLGLGDWDPRLAHTTHMDSSYSLAAPIVQQQPLSETDMLKDNYITLLSKASLDELRSEKYGSKSRPDALLYMLLRHSLLLSYADSAFELQVRYQMAQPREKRETELINMRASAPTKTAWDRLEQPIPAITSTASVGSYLQSLTTFTDPEVTELGEIKDSLSRLEILPTAKLERLATQTLDLCSHRLDAWITSLVTKRVTMLRHANPTGIILGAYGWVEELKPSEPRTVVSGTPGGSQLTVDPNNEGYMHAPSLAHASTAAVLRNGYISHADPAKHDMLAIDLSSEKVRQSLKYLDGIRQGQPLAALLGYTFERGLHENHPGLELDLYIYIFRYLYPLDANKLVKPTEPTENVSARNVVDGRKLLEKWKAGDIPFGVRLQGIPGNPGLPSAPSREYQAIISELKNLDEILHGIGDLSVAEAVYQLIQGNYLRSGAVLDSTSRGEIPLEPEFILTPRSGISLTNRALLVFTGNPMPLGPWAFSKDNPRARAEPHLNAWVGAMLGDPGKVKCYVTYPDPSPSHPDATSTKVVKLSDLELCPLDVLYLGLTDERAMASDLEKRIAYSLARDLQGEKLEIRFIPDASYASWDRSRDKSFPEMLEFVRAIRDLILGATPAEPKHFGLPEESGPKDDTGLKLTELRDRAAQAERDLKGLLARIDSELNSLAGVPPSAQPSLTRLREAMFEASLFGVLGAIPNSAEGDSKEKRDALVSQANYVKLELKKRDDSMAAEDKRFSELSAATSAVERGHLINKLKAAFGMDFQVLTIFSPTNASEFLTSCRASDTLQGGDGNASIKWFQQRSEVQPRLARYQRVMMLAEALSTGPKLSFRVAQLPHQANDRWMAMLFDTSHSPRQGCVSLVVALPGGYDPSTEYKEYAGLVLDEEVEKIPSATQMTGIAFHHRDPTAQAPNVVLLVVAPETRENWQLDDAISSVEGAIDLVRIRSVDPDRLGFLGQFLPALYFANNLKAATVQTDFQTVSYATTQPRYASGVGRT